jgi:hypothetical protein
MPGEGHGQNNFGVGGWWNSTQAGQESVSGFYKMCAAGTQNGLNMGKPQSGPW